MPHKENAINNGNGAEELLTIDELSARLKVKKTWIYRHVSLKNLRVHKAGKYNRFYWSEVLEDLEAIRIGE